MTSILVTGATSFVGLELCDRLAVRGMVAHALVRSTSDVSRLMSLTTPPTCHMVEDGMDNMAEIVARVGPDAVVHMAGRFVKNDADADLAALIDSNVTFGTSVLAASAAAGVKSFVNTGSYYQFDDGDRRHSYNLYAATKEAFEAIIAYYRQSWGLRTTTLVLFDTYGPRDWRGKLLPAIIGAQRSGDVLPLPSDDPTMDLVHGRDVADAFIAAAQGLNASNDLDGRTFAVRTGDPVGVRALVAAVERVGGTNIATSPGAWPPPPRPLPPLWDGPMVPGWSPQVTLEAGIQEMIEASA